MDAVRKMGFISTNILFLLLYEARKHKEGQGFLVHPGPHDPPSRLPQQLTSRPLAVSYLAIKPPQERTAIPHPLTLPRRSRG